MCLIIGLNAFHPDSAACALKDGKLVAAVAEERLGPRRTCIRQCNSRIAPFARMN